VVVTVTGDYPATRALKGIHPTRNEEDPMSLPIKKLSELFERSSKEYGSFEAQLFYNAVYNSHEYAYATAFPTALAAVLAAEGNARCNAVASCAVVRPDEALEVIPGIVTAKNHGSPLVIITIGEVEALLRTSHSLCKDVIRASDGNETSGLEAALKASIEGSPGPVLLSLPASKLYFPGVICPFWVKSPMTLRPAVLSRLATALLSAKRILLVLGQSAIQANPEEILHLVESLPICVATTLAAKGLVPEGHPQWLWGGLGASSPPPLRAIAEGCDVALILGADMGETDTGGYTALLPKSCFHVHGDLLIPGANLPAHPIVCNVKDFLSGISSTLKGRAEELGSSSVYENKSILEVEVAYAHREIKAWYAKKRETSPIGAGMDPLEIFEIMQGITSEGTVFLADAELSATARDHLRCTRPCRFYTSEASTPGYAISAAHGALSSCNPKNGLLKTSIDGDSHEDGGKRMAVALLTPESVPESLRYLRRMQESNFEAKKIVMVIFEFLNGKKMKALTSFDLSALESKSGTHVVQVVTPKHATDFVTLLESALKSDVVTLISVQLQSLPSYGTEVSHGAIGAPKLVVAPSYEAPMRSSRRYMFHEFDPWRFLLRAVSLHGEKEAVIDLDEQRVLKGNPNLDTNPHLHHTLMFNST